MAPSVSGTVATIIFVTLIRSLDDLDTLKDLAEEATFYDKHWNESWENAERPSESE